jgi:hypothetical protein
MYLSSQHFNPGMGGTNFKPILSEVTKLGAKSSNGYNAIGGQVSRPNKSRGSKASITNG